MSSDALFRAKAPGIMNLLMADFALDLESAAAIVGNLGHESGGFQFLQEKQPLVPGSAGGYGWAQWTGPRRRAYEAYCARNGLDPAGDTANYKFLFVELSGSERAAIPAVRNAIGLDAKVQAFEAAFERAGIKHYESRSTWAQRALDAYRANPGGTIDVKDAGEAPNTGIVTGIVLPPDIGVAGPAAVNPVAGIIPALQGHKDEARKLAMGVLGAFNMFYPDDPIVVQPKAAPVESKTDRPSVQLGFAGVVGSLIAMATGHLGTPLGMGEAPTVAGNVAPLVSALVGGVGLLGGGWGGLAKAGLSIVGSLASLAVKK